MAVYYFRNVGTDWNTASNWSLSDGGGATGAVPTAADDAYFTSNSGSCTVSTASRVCKTLIFSGVGAGNYASTFTLNNTLTVSGNVTLSSSMTFAGTSTLTINATSTLTSNGQTLTSNLTLSGTSVTLTLGDNVTVNGNFSLGAQTITGNTLYVGGGLIQTAAGVSSVLNSNIELIGTGNITNLGSGANFGGTGTITINTTGVITVTGLNLAGNGRSFVYTAGALNFTGGATFFCTSGTFTIDMKGYPISVPAASAVSLATNGGTISLASDFVVDGGIFAVGSGALPAGQSLVLSSAGGNLYLGRNNLPTSIRLTSGTVSNTGTASIYIRGGGVCDFTFASAIPLNIIFDFTGIIRMANGTSFGNEVTGMIFSTGTYTFLNGRFISQNNVFVKNQGRLDITGSATLIGFDKFSGIGNIRITNGVTVTMDKFFAGRPDCITNVFCATATGSYTVAFQDDSEKLANWVRVSNCTLSRRGQLLILNQKGVNNTARNTGVRYTNSWPNGAPKHSPFTPDNSTAYGAGGLLADPAFTL